MPPFATKMACPAAEQDRTADLLNAMSAICEQNEFIENK